MIWSKLPPQTWIGLWSLYDFINGDRFKSFYHMFILVFDQALMILGKLTYAAPRPYFADLEIEAVVCEKYYGNPSGHSSGASLLLITFFLDIVQGRD